jgi:hypothetical protein
MQNTINYNLKKPDYTDFADIKDINDNMDKIDEELAAPTGDTADSTATFTCSDVADGDAAAWTNVPALTSGETHKSLFAKMSQMFKNIRYLYKMLGTTDISSIGDGTVTNALSVLNAKALLSWVYGVQFVYTASSKNTTIVLFTTEEKTANNCARFDFRADSGSIQYRVYSAGTAVVDRYVNFK